ncbi:unnamed protein product [Ectocarpus sp. 8 AP-2014]
MHVMCTTRHWGASGIPSIFAEPLFHIVIFLGPARRSSNSGIAHLRCWLQSLYLPEKEVPPPTPVPPIHLPALSLSLALSPCLSFGSSLLLCLLLCGVRYENFCKTRLFFGGGGEQQSHSPIKCNQGPMGQAVKSAAAAQARKPSKSSSSTTTTTTGRERGRETGRERGRERETSTPGEYL